MGSSLSHKGNTGREHLRGEVSAESVVDIDLPEEHAKSEKVFFPSENFWLAQVIITDC